MADTFDTVLEPLRHILMDMVAWNPGLETHAATEFTRLSNICRTRGTLKTLMSDLPSAGKHLDFCLSRGHLFNRDYPHSLGSLNKGTQLFYALYSLIFNSPAAGEVILSEPDPTAVFFLRQILLAYKKVEEPCNQICVNRAVQEYIDIDAGLRNPTLPWNSEADFYEQQSGSQVSSMRFMDLIHDDRDLEFDLLDNTLSSKLLSALDLASELLGSQVELVDAYSLLPKHGPGAVSDMKTGGDKYSFPSWSKKLDHFLPEEYFAYSTEELAYLNGLDRADLSIHPAKLMAVPKTIDKPRLITIEPTANQFLQQGLMKWFRDSLPKPLRHCIDFRSQEPSRALVKSASRDGYLSTVDLSSASDRLSCWTVERAFRHYGGVLPLLYGTRTHLVIDGTNSKLFTELELMKFAGQGSAVTFPVQSIIYAMICIASLSVAEGQKLSSKNLVSYSKRIQVYGDDLILPSFAVPCLDILLQLLQLKMNVMKTHTEGRYRESCGMDCFLGIDVTPLYLTAFDLGKGPRALTSWVDVSNNAHIKGLWHLTKWMDSKLGKLSKLIPISSKPRGSLTRHTFLLGYDIGMQSPIKKWDENLHHYKVKGLVPVAKTRTRRRETHSNLLQYFLEYEPAGARFLHHLDRMITFEAGYTMSVFFTLKKTWLPAD